MICLSFAFFAFSIGLIKWAAIPEIFPTKTRGRAIATVAACWATR